MYSVFENCNGKILFHSHFQIYPSIKHQKRSFLPKLLHLYSSMNIFISTKMTSIFLEVCNKTLMFLSGKVVILFAETCMIWIFYEDSSDNTSMFLVFAEQCLHRVKDFPCIALLARGTAVHKKLGRDRTRTVDSD